MVVITEGKNDFYTMNYFQKVLNNKNIINIIPGTSASNLETLISLYLGWGSKFIVILDDDKQGNIQKERYLNIFGDIVANSIFTLKDINSTWEKCELEKLINIEDQEKIIKEIYDDSEINKTVLNRSLQELYIKNSFLNFSKETKANFGILFNFIKEELKKNN